MGKDNRICFLCGKNYSYCPTCNEDVFKPMWYAMWCSVNCKEIDNILAAYTVGQIGDIAAKEMLEGLRLDFSTVEMDESAREVINKIMDSGNKPKAVVTDCEFKTSSNMNNNHKKHGKKQK